MPPRPLLRLLSLALVSSFFSPDVVEGALSASQSEALYQQMLKEPQFKAADRELSTVYAQVRQRMDPAAQNRLRDQQRQWLKSKDDALSEATPGARTALALQLTRDRVRELKGLSHGGSAPAASPEDARGNKMDVEVQLAKLKSRDPDARIEALRELEYSLDPRLPEVMLRLLSDSGDSIRRVAAHGIGSRWWQVPKGRVEFFVSKMKEAAKKEGESEGGELCRSIDLLQQSVGKRMEFPKAVSLSPNGRWIIYDRLGSPCLIDVQNQTEEILGWPQKDWEGRFLGEGLWHPTKEVALVSFHTRRGPASLCVWTHGKGVKVVGKSSFMDLLQKKKLSFHEGMFSLNTEDAKWKGDRLSIPASFEDIKTEKSYSASFLWDASLMELRLESVRLDSAK